MVTLRLAEIATQLKLDASRSTGCIREKRSCPMVHTALMSNAVRRFGSFKNRIENRQTDNRKR
jgi:hypothetical protein